MAMKNNTIKRLTAVTVIIGIVNLIIAALFVLRLPDTVPTHFDASFVCNGTGSRWLGILLPIVVLAIFPLGLLITSKSKNIEKNIKPLTIILLFIEVMLIAVSWFILIVMDSGAQLGDKIPANFVVLLPFIIGLMFVVMGNYLPTVRQNKNLGIKLPWTLKNERCWDVTHRFAGKVWVAAGLLTLAGTAVLWHTGTGSDTASIILTIVPTTFAIVIPTVYAYLHRND